MSEAAAHDNSDKPDADKPEVGTSLAPAAEVPGGIDPFLAKVDEAPEAATSRPFYAKALDYSAHAAMIVGLVGFAWTVSDHVVRRQPADLKPAKLADSTATPVAGSGTMAATATPAEATRPDEIGDLRKANQKMASEIRGLHASLEALRATVVRERSSGDDVHALSAALEAARSNMASLKSEQAAALAQLSGKVEKLQREARAQAAADRLPAHAEQHQPIDTTTTASIPAAAPPRQAPARTVPTPPSKPTVLASAEPPAHADMGRPDTDAGKLDEAKPQVIQGWVVRDVYEGVALIEGRRGQMEVVPGVSIPGAGVVKSIERHGSGWTVTTTKGQVAYATPMRDYRRGPGPMRDYYGPSRRYDF